MRFLWAAIMAGALFGSVALCQYHVTRTVEFHLAQDAEGEPGRGAAAGRYAVVLTPGFDMGADPFAVRDEGAVDASLRVSTAQGILFERTGDAGAGEPVTITNVPLAGARAELFIEAVPAAGAAGKSLPLRVQVLKDGALCDDTTLWTEGGGAKLERRVPVSLEPRRHTLDRGMGNAEGRP